MKKRNRKCYVSGPISGKDLDERRKAFKAAFKDMPGVTTFEHELVTYDGQCTDFDGSAYVDKLEWVAIIATDGKFMVYINNPGCPVDADGCPIFTKEHPQQQLVFGYYESFNMALNRAVAITKARKYPKPIEIW